MTPTLALIVDQYSIVQNYKEEYEYYVAVTILDGSKIKIVKSKPIKNHDDAQKLCSKLKVGFFLAIVIKLPITFLDGF